MKFIRDLIGKNREDETTAPQGGVDPLEQSYRDTIGSLTEPAASTPPEPAAAPNPAPVNIWDLDPQDSASALPDTSPSANPARVAARARRTKTRLIGFEKSNGDVVDLFSDAPKTTSTQRVRFPVGWIVVTDGPGRGESFALLAGMSQIGRGEDQAIQLDFGDTTISRNNHAAIVYDPETSAFLLGHGGKANIVRLNDKPVISNEELKNGDVIRIGETKLRFVALCDASFNWAQDKTAGDDDVAIA
jgi:hypothetical protein